MTKEEIHNICERYNIEDYSINPDMSIDVNGSVDLRFKHLIHIPLQFNKISGMFTCNYNLLTSLEGCPIYVGDNFNCKFNYLTSLEYCPTYIGGGFWCSKNSVTKRIPVICTFVHGKLHSDNLWKF